MPSPPVARLHLHLAAAHAPHLGGASLAEHRGGRSALLRWLETGLGLLAEPVPVSSRVTQYASTLAAHPGASFAPSLATDRWATASELLARRDALLLAGWDLRDAPALPPLARDLARAEADHRIAPGEAERLAAVRAALDAGQRLPPHAVVLHEPAEQWPAAWRPVLARLRTEPAPPVQPQAPSGSGLRAGQDLLLGQAGATPRLDASLRFAGARSAVAACQALAAMLAAEPGLAARTTVLCEDEDTALLLDRALHRLGVPTMGASRHSAAQPPLQVLPLVLALCWDPVDPQALLEFLTLPHSPLPNAARYGLARALARQPGFGSAKWNEAWARATSPEQDPEGRTRERLEAWLHPERRPRGEAMPTALVAARCRLVAQWAMRASLREAEPGGSEELCRAFRVAAAQAQALGDLAQSQGEAIAGPQLDRLLEEVLRTGATQTPLPALAAGPRLVRSLAEVVAPTDVLVWLGTGTADPPTSPWTHTELQALQRAGLDVDDGARDLAILRRAERRGLAQVRERLLVVRLPQDAERRTHPVWLQLHAAMPRVDGKAPPPVYVEDALRDGAAALAPWRLAGHEAPVEPPQPQRPVWHVPAEALVGPERVSATELADRLACPAKWMLTHAADLGRGDALGLPPEHILLGTFCHRVLEVVLRPWTKPDAVPAPAEAAAEVERVFDELLPRDAATLAMPAKRALATRVRGELARATERLVEALHRGGYHVVAMEAPVEGTLLDQPAAGRIDCVLGTEDGEEAILDFKYPGGKKYRDRILRGHAVQLAVYAAARSAQTGRPVHGIGYFLLRDANLQTPQGSPLRGTPPGWQTRGARSADATWQAFLAALQGAADWLDTGEVPARPLLPSRLRPTGAEMVIEDVDGKGYLGEPCSHCSYKVLCGREARP